MRGFRSSASASLGSILKDERIEESVNDDIATESGRLGSAEAQRNAFSHRPQSSRMLKRLV